MKMKPSEWLSENTDSHNVYDSVALRADYLKSVGAKAPRWPERTPAAVRQMMESRGLGGTLSAEPAAKLANGYEIAESVCEALLPGVEHDHGRYEGRGTRHRAAIAQLAAAGK
jgi:hypothetical protein